MWSISRAWLRWAWAKANPRGSPQVTNTPSTAGCLPTWCSKASKEPLVSPVKTPSLGGSSAAPLAAAGMQAASASATASTRMTADALAPRRPVSSIGGLDTGMASRLPADAARLALDSQTPDDRPSLRARDRRPPAPRPPDGDRRLAGGGRRGRSGPRQLPRSAPEEARVRSPAGAGADPHPSRPRGRHGSHRAAVSRRLGVGPRAGGPPPDRPEQAHGQRHPPVRSADAPPVGRGAPRAGGSAQGAQRRGEAGSVPRGLHPRTRLPPRLLPA